MLAGDVEALRWASEHQEQPEVAKLLQKCFAWDRSRERGASRKFADIDQGTRHSFHTGLQRTQRTAALHRESSRSCSLKASRPKIAVTRPEFNRPRQRHEGVGSSSAQVVGALRGYVISAPQFTRSAGPADTRRA